MHRLFLTTALVLAAATVSADDNGNGFPSNGNGYPNSNNGNNNGNGYPNNNGNSNGNGYPNNNGNNNGNGYPNNNNGNSNSNGYARVIEKYQSYGNTSSPRVTTSAFTAPDKWEIFWMVTGGSYNLTIVSASDGTVVAGSKISNGGSLYLSKAGLYYLQIDVDPTASGRNWLLLVADARTGTQLSRSDPNNNFSATEGITYNHPDAIIPPTGFAESGAGSPNNMVPNSGGGYPQNAFAQQNMAAPPPSPAPIVKLTEDQERAVVLIKGDNAEGTGFLIKTPDGPQVVTNIHVIANNPNLKVTTNTGALIPVLSSKGASDRDLALLAIKDNGYSYLDVAQDISKTVQPGDEVVTPGNSQGGEVMLNTGGKVLGIGPERIEFDNPIYHGNSGGPVFHTKSGKVLGVVTEAMKVNTSDDLDKVSFSNRNSAISGQMRYFGLRLDTVTAWIPIDSQQFQIETAFLDQFHDQSRRLDAYLNSDAKGRTDDGQDVSNLYLNDEKIMKAVDNFRQRCGGADVSQQMDAQRDFVFDLQSIADINVMQIKSANNFYSFDQGRARDELDYRNALKKEIDSISSNVDRMSHLPRTNN